MEWDDAGSNSMTTWTKDDPPSGTTSMIIGCWKAGVGRVGDSSECNNECEPPPTVVIEVSGSIDVNVTVSGG